MFSHFEDIKALKIRSIGSETIKSVFKTIGSKKTPLAFKNSGKAIITTDYEQKIKYLVKVSELGARKIMIVSGNKNIKLKAVSLQFMKGIEVEVGLFDTVHDFK